MKKNRIKKLTILILIFSLSVSHTVAYASSEVNKLKEQHKEAKEQVDAINKQKDQTKKETDSLKEEAGTLTSKINTLNGQISAVVTEINSTENDILLVEAEITSLENQIADTEASCELQTSSMKKRIQYMYENRSTNTAVNLLESGSLSELLQRLEYMAAITKYDRTAIVNYQATQAQLTESKALVDDKHQELTAKQNELEGKKTQLGGLVAENNGLLKEKNSKIANNEATLEQLEAQLKEAKAKEEELRDAYNDAQRKLAESMAGYSEYTGGAYEGYSDYEMLLLAAVVQAEADNQGDDGRLAVASVVMNRVFSSKFPNSIAEVVYSPNQFAPVASGRVDLILAQGPNKNCQRAAVAALNGDRRTTAIFFFTNSYAQQVNEKNVSEGTVPFFERTIGESIGAHYFFNYI